MPINNEEIKNNTMLRYDYYSAGRELFFNQNTTMSGIMLGYSIELSLKLLLQLKGMLSQKLFNSHSVNDLFDIASSAYPELETVSKDLILFINDRLDQRYIRGKNRVMKFHVQDGRVQDFPLEIIHYYDKLYYELDRLCWITSEKYNFSSSLYRVLKDLKSYKSRAVFHINYSLHNKLNELDSILNQDEDKDDLIYFNNEKDKLWDFNFMFVTYNKPFNIDDVKNDLMKFEYLKWEIDQDGKEYCTFKFNQDYSVR